MTKDSKTHAFVMICSESGPHNGSLEELNKMPEVVEAHAVYGVYDEMVRVKTETMLEFREVNQRIRSLPNIRSTITMFIE